MQCNVKHAGHAGWDIMAGKLGEFLKVLTKLGKFEPIFSIPKKLLKSCKCLKGDEFCRIGKKQGNSAKNVAKIAEIIVNFA